ncbi:MAG: SUMF1/EgtB/PvdO family nonheme iron enzyme, partial [Polyangiaceae bacterium]
LDMSGNVWEWVADDWEPDPAKHVGTVDPLVSGNSTRGLLRGGSWDFSGAYATTTRRLPLDAGEGHVSQGVRCAKNSAEEAPPKAN